MTHMNEDLWAKPLIQSLECILLVLWVGHYDKLEKAALRRILLTPRKDTIMKVPPRRNYRLCTHDIKPKA